MMETDIADGSRKAGLIIEKPSVIKLSAIYPFLLIFSLLLVGTTLWFLILEYLGEPPTAWVREVFENFVLAI